MIQDAEANKLMLELRTATIEVLNETNKVVPRRMCKLGERYRTMSAKWRTSTCDYYFVFNLIAGALDGSVFISRSFIAFGLKLGIS